MTGVWRMVCVDCGLPLVANGCPYCATRATRELGQNVRARTRKGDFEEMTNASFQVRGELEFLDWAIGRQDVDATRKSVAHVRNLLQRITLACELVELDATDQAVDRERERADDGTNPKDI